MEGEGWWSEMNYEERKGWGWEGGVDGEGIVEMVKELRNGEKEDYDWKKVEKGIDGGLG